MQLLSLVPYGLLLLGLFVVMVACTRNPLNRQAYLSAARTGFPDLPQSLSSPLPRVLAEIALTPAATLLDLRHDHANQRLYVSDTAGNLHIIDSVSYAVLATVQALGGELTLDVPHHRLYAAPGAAYFHGVTQANTITVLDTLTYAIIGQLPGRHLAIDAIHHQLFVGESSNSSDTGSNTGIRVYDGAGLTLTETLPQTGIPFYNPLRNELLILAQTLQVYDLAQQKAVPTQFPASVTAVHLFPAENLIAVYDAARCTTGCVLTAPPYFFDATTLEALPYLADLPELQANCGSQKMILPAIMGQTYRTYALQRQVHSMNLLVQNDYGDTIAWRDGLMAQFVNPQTLQAYLAGGKVLDLTTLTPVGTWPESCIFAYNERAGLLYANAGPGLLRVIDQQGGQPHRPEAPLPASPVGHTITAILPSPDYADDQTILLLTQTGALLRSTDGGDQWHQLRGGLPTGNRLKLQVAFSPDYGIDRTLFAAGYHDSGEGEGVFRSTDGGDTWSQIWQGLTHLRITELRFSPLFSRNRTLWAKAAYHQVASGEAGYSWHRTTVTDDMTWSLVATGATEPALAEELDFVLDFPVQAVDMLPVRIRPMEHRLDYRPDATASWQPIALPLAEDEWMLSLHAAPTHPQHHSADKQADEIIYALSDYHLWRTVDGGQTWQRWQSESTLPRVYPNSFHLLALTPPALDGRYYLILSMHNGQMLVLDATAQAWQDQALWEAAQPASIVTDQR